MGNCRKVSHSLRTVAPLKAASPTNPCSKQGHLEEAVQDCSQVGFEYLWGGDSATSLGILLHYLITLMGKKKSYVSVEFPVLQLVLTVLYLPWIQPRGDCLRSFTPTWFYSHSHPQLHMEMLPPLEPLFSRLNIPSLLRLSSCEMLRSLNDLWALCCTFQEHPCLCCLGSLMEGSGCWGWLPWASHACNPYVSRDCHCAGNLLEPPVPALLLHCGRDNPAA